MGYLAISTWNHRRYAWFGVYGTLCFNYLGSIAHLLAKVSEGLSRLAQFDILDRPALVFFRPVFLLT